SPILSRSGPIALASILAWSTPGAEAGLSAWRPRAFASESLGAGYPELKWIPARVHPRRDLFHVSLDQEIQVIDGTGPEQNEDIPLVRSLPPKFFPRRCPGWELSSLSPATG